MDPTVKKARMRLRKALAAVKKARAALSRAKTAAWRPPIVKLGLAIEDKYGPLGTVHTVTGHHSAMEPDRDRADALRLCRLFHDAHKSKGWGGIGYHFNIARDGAIICLRPVALKGAHVGGWNSGNVGVMFHGTTGDEPTDAQRRSYAWLLANAHTVKMPASHRTSVDLRTAKRRGHNDWPGHESNACPGTHKPMILAGG
jgi:hypothetical protein